MIKVGIVGGTGYTGVELLRLLSQHPKVQLTAITSRKEAGMPVAEMFPSLRGRVDLCFTTPEEAKLTECDAVFLQHRMVWQWRRLKNCLPPGLRYWIWLQISVLKILQNLKNGTECHTLALTSWQRLFMAWQKLIVRPLKRPESLVWRVVIQLLFSWVTPHCCRQNQQVEKLS